MPRIHAVLFASAVALALAGGCASTLQQKPEAPESLGFLAGVYDKLEPGSDGQVALRYENPNANWSQYHQILLDPVQFWAGDESKLSPDAAQMLTTYFYNAMKENLEKGGFSLAQLPGPGVLRAQLALLDASAATPIMRTVSLVVPQALLINSAQRLFSDKYAFSGHIEVALRASDAQTGALLAAGLDRRSGGGGIQQAAQWKWGDAEAAMDHWAQLFTKRLQEFQARMRAR
jgi:hypothetical protein